MLPHLSHVYVCAYAYSFVYISQVAYFRPNPTKQEYGTKGTRLGRGGHGPGVTEGCGRMGPSGVGLWHGASCCSLAPALIYRIVFSFHGFGQIAPYYGCKVKS